MQEVFAGSTSKYIFRHCTFCPVVVVHVGEGGGSTVRREGA